LVFKKKNEGYTRYSLVLTDLAPMAMLAVFSEESTQAPMLGLAKLRVTGNKLLGRCPGLFHQRAIRHDIRQLKLKDAALPGSVDITRPPELHILLGNGKAVGRGHYDAHALLAVLADLSSRQQDAIGLFGTAAS